MPRAVPGAAVSVDRFLELSILGLAASGFLAVASSGGHDIAALILTAAGLAARALMIFRRLRFALPQRFVLAAALLFAGFFPLDYLFVSRALLPAAVHLLLFVATISILTARSNRGYLFTATIAFLELMAAAVLSVSLSFFICLAAYLVFAMAALTSAEIRRSMERGAIIARSGQRPLHPRLTGLTAAVALGVLVLTGGLFLLLPRTANAAFRGLISAGYVLPGFSNRVTLGQIGRIKTSSKAVMHVRFSGAVEGEGLKWRGGALSGFDGKQWSNPPTPGQVLHLEDGQITLADERQRLRKDGRRIAYRVEFNGIATDTLFFAGIPEALNDLGSADLIRTVDGNYRMDRIPGYGFHYEAWSFLPAPGTGADMGDSLPGPMRRRYLELPRLDPRIAQLARDVTEGEFTSYARAAALEHHLRTDYGYSLAMPSQAEPDPLAAFLFERKKGYCEHFASAMTVMLRTLGIPARLVNGFQSGTYNPISRQFVIRASDAHSWVEAYLPGRGWSTFDPTPPETAPRRATLWSTLSLYLDAADTFWQEWVLSYNLGHQVDLARRMERSGTRLGLNWLTQLVLGMELWQENVRAFVARYWMLVLWTIILPAAGIVAAPRLWRRLRMRRRLRQVRRGQASMADATLLYNRMLERLEHRGFSKPPWFTPQEFAATLPPSEIATLVRKFTTAYNGLRFGGNADAATQLSALLDKLEQVP